MQQRGLKDFDQFFGKGKGGDADFMWVALESELLARAYYSRPKHRGNCWPQVFVP